MGLKTLSEVRWGIIGVGDVCERKSAPAMSKIKNSSLVAVMRRNAEKAKDFASRHNVPRWYADADELINDPEVNTVYIATPPHVHLDYTRRAAAAGKAVYVEKPMARNYMECQAMVELCEEAGVPLFVAYYRRMLPNILKIRSLLKEGAIGDIRLVDVKIIKPLEPDIVGASRDSANWRIYPEISGGGYFFDLASHQLDVLDYLFGPVLEAQGYAHNQAGVYPAEDIVAGTFHFETGVIGLGTWCFNASETSDCEATTIVGSKGQIKFNYFADHSVVLEIYGRKTERLTFEIPYHIQQPLIQAIVNELLGKGKCPSTGVTAARTGKVMDMLCRRIEM